MDREPELAILLDTYEKLLTGTQAKILHLRFDDDLSLGEIGQECGISRQAARDAIVKGEQKLLAWEQALHLAEKDRVIRELIAQMEKDPEKNDDYLSLLKHLTEDV